MCVWIGVGVSVYALAYVVMTANIGVLLWL